MLNELLKLINQNRAIVVLLVVCALSIVYKEGYLNAPEVGFEGQQQGGYPMHYYSNNKRW